MSGSARGKSKGNRFSDILAKKDIEKKINKQIQEAMEELSEQQKGIVNGMIRVQLDAIQTDFD